MRAGNFITRQCKAILENRQQAILYAVVFSVLPFASWISVALVSLVTLRKGAKSGFDVLLPALVIHSVPLIMLIPLSGAIANTLITYLPCYFAALILRNTESWQMVAGVFFIMALLGCLFLQLLAPGFIVGQFHQLKMIFPQYQELVDSTLYGISSSFLAQLFFGIQILSVIVSAAISLMFARSLQAKLFLPGGFRNELMAFRSGRLSFLVFLGVLLATFYEIPLAMNILPIVLFYFIASGFGLVYFIFSRKRQMKVFILLILLLLVKPIVVLGACIVLGSVDSLVNFRSYFPSRVGESI
ncbi:hypothetical protein OQJ18_05020 [Fluoribacter dumoffii]|uniref:Transmembrane protein n=1 Tax=Fluoribacter dumoffii TaxID=463 RepID=A0A377G936_9GAMM|nr:hypothetical protein [Fluoribacter dumoffii]KTC90205.1 transmembrane protein [Fluoribacter dumoffii NY 23]MCW8385523.1 hypothetical protein [Fluoribacter dumoffii]MCW8418551.1 hypothetical protein [Fluoribacter dumoffii]MCW8453607.1 hypothetical protein [Fluoribacter dumoffii]MCW8459175.1 hypothetical protein [Fluoribacter dumoffii]